MAAHNATPGAEKEAQKRGVELSAVQGTGQDGRITQEDVQRFADDQDKQREADEAEKTYEVSLSPQRSSIEVVAVLDGQRRAFRGGERVSAAEKEELAKVKGRTREGRRIQALNFKEVSA